MQSETQDGATNWHRQSLPPDARRSLEDALAGLRSTNAIVRFSALLGGLLNRAGNATLGPQADEAMTQIARIALDRAFDVALVGVNAPDGGLASLPLVAASGMAGGAAGLAGFLPDATFTTLVIMRDIARAARTAGEDLRSDATRAACVQVFFLKAGDEAGYLSARLMVTGTAARGLLARAAAGWGAMLGEKFAAGAVPVLSAATAAVLNAAFLDHYRKLASAHFTIRRLERQHGRETIRLAAGWPLLAVDEPFFEE